MKTKNKIPIKDWEKGFEDVYPMDAHCRLYHSDVKNFICLLLLSAVDSVGVEKLKNIEEIKHIGKWKPDTKIRYGYNQAIDDLEAQKTKLKKEIEGK